VPPVRKHAFVVAADDTGLRLDQLLARHVTELSRRKARLVIELGGVFVDKKRVKVAGRVLRPGQRVEVHLGGVFERAQPAAQRAGPAEVEAAGLDAVRLVHVDDAWVVVDKPAGILSAPTPESDQGNLARWLRERLGGEVHVVHRLDRLTSGLLVYARSGPAAARLSESLRSHELEREYELAVVGRVAFREMEVTAPVRGKDARTRFTVVATKGDASRLRARLFTGRTHQIRIHALGLGHPVCGDPVYRSKGEGTSGPRAPRLCLHARSLSFAHPVTGQAQSFESPWPDELEAWWHGLIPPRAELE
jgi:23S rRNA pseudouridine1911/1915/1917 synthase